MRLTAGIGLIVVAGALVVGLRALPYSTVLLAAVDASDAMRAPSSSFAIGPLLWQVSDLAGAPALQTFRNAMRGACGDARGIAAAECATKVLTDRIPVGSPESEFVRIDFDPVAHFKAHMAGAPGHCMTRSAILATQLLSVGIPARVVQFVPVDDKGHTLVEVWDDSLGWAVVDPSSGGYVVGASSRAAIDLLAQPASVDWRPFGFTKANDAEVAQQNVHFRQLLAGNVLYPEPWLYLRVGERIAPWPFRGEYARVGAPFLTLGPLQHFLFWAIPAIALLGVALCATSWMYSAPVRDAAWKKSSPTGVGEVGGLDIPSN
jgi:hypothetical protein